MRALRQIPLLGLVLAVLSAAGSAFAQIVPVAREAVAVRGEPLLVEVRVGPDARVLPIELASRGGAKSLLPGRLLWPFVPEPADGSLARWATATNPLRIADERPPAADSAYLAIDLPADAPDDAVLAIGTSSVALSVFDAARPELLAQLALRASMIAPQGARDPMLSLPDPAAPFERFRFAIGTALRGWPEPPAFPDGSGDATAARASTALWLAALSRAAAGGTGPVVELAELLVATCGDTTAPAPVAAWISSPEELRSLLKLMFAREFTSARVSSSVNEFLRVRSPLLWWIEDSDRTSVTVAFANPTTREQLAKYQWIAGSESDVLPLALDVPAAEVRRTRITRPTTARTILAGDRPAQVELLHVASSGVSANLVVPPAVLPTDARGLELSECYAPLNLLSVATAARVQPLALRGTRMSVRERLAGWEIFVDFPADGADASTLRARGAGGGEVEIRADGTHSADGCTVAGDAVEFAADRGRARASFVVPPEWIRRDDLSTLAELGFRRTFAGGFADAPFPCVPWRSSPRTGSIDLSPKQ